MLDLQENYGRFVVLFTEAIFVFGLIQICDVKQIPSL